MKSIAGPMIWTAARTTNDGVSTSSPMVSPKRTRTMPITNAFLITKSWWAAMTASGSIATNPLATASAASPKLTRASSRRPAGIA